MNRYYVSAIVLGLITAVALAAIWVVTVSDPALQKKIELTLTTLSCATGILTLILPLIGRCKRSEETSLIEKETLTTSLPEDFPHSNGSRLDFSTSVAQYIGNMEMLLDHSGRIKRNFVKLSAEAAQEDICNLGLLQSFEWAKRDTFQEVQRVDRAPINILTAHEQFQRYVLLGEPGAGKTTSLVYLALELLDKVGSGKSDVYPLYVSLTEWYDKKQSALAFLSEKFRRTAGPNSALTSQFEILLSQGRLVVILDGLNEMPFRDNHPHNNVVSASDSGFIRNISSSVDLLRVRQDPRERSLRELATSIAVRSIFILSCRTHEFFQSLKWPEIYILPLTNGQIKTFIEKCMTPEKAKNLQHAVEKNTDLMGLASNPFFLYNMIALSDAGLTLVSNRGQFLDYLHTRLIEREAQRGGARISKKATEVVANLALKMLQKDMIGSEVAIRLRRKIVRQAISAYAATGLLVVKENGHVSFYHQLIQEYFAAVALRNSWRYRSIKYLLHSKKWCEVIVIWHSIDPGRSVLKRLLKALKARNTLWHKPYSMSLKYILFLILIFNTYAFIITNLLIDSIWTGYLQSKLIASPEAFLFVTFLIPMLLRYSWILLSYQKTVISNAAYVLGRIENPIAIDHLIEALRHYNFSTVSGNEIARAIAKFGEVAVPGLASALLRPNIATRMGSVEALGLIGGRKVVDPLIGVIIEGNLKLIPFAISALGKTGDPRAIKPITDALALAKQLPSILYRTKYNSLGISLREFHQAHEVLYQLLDSCIRSDQPLFWREIGIKMIAGYGHPDGLVLLKKIAKNQQESETIRSTALENIGALGTEEAVNTLIDFAAEKNELYNKALFSLSNVRSAAGRHVLRTGLDHTLEDVQDACVIALGLIGDPEAVPMLARLSKNSSQSTKEDIARSLGMIGASEGIETLKELCRNPENSVREVAIESLDFVFPDAAKDFFMELAFDSSYQAREKIVDCLGHYRERDVRTLLLNLCADQDDDVKGKAIESLRRLDQGLSDELHYVRRTKRGSRLKRCWVFFFNKLKIPIFNRLVKEIRLAGKTKEEAWPEAIQRIAVDFELKREFGLIMKLMLFIILALLLIAPGMFVAIVSRTLLAAESILLDTRWISLGVVLISAASYLPWVNLGQNQKQIGLLYFIIRFLGTVTLIIWLGYVTVRWWWFSLPIITIVGFLVMTPRGVFEKVLKQLKSGE